MTIRDRYNLPPYQTSKVPFNTNNGQEKECDERIHLALHVGTSRLEAGDTVHAGVEGGRDVNADVGLVAIDGHTSPAQVGISTKLGYSPGLPCRGQ